MADEVLKIRVDVETASANQVRDAIKAINKEIGELPLNSEKAKALREEMNALKIALDKAAGGTGALMKSYFALGEELRRTAVASGGYITKLQLEEAAARLAKDANISLAEATKQVKDSAEHSGVKLEQSMTQTIKGARQEARMFRFALLEMTHGIDGVVNSFANIMGAGEGTKETLKGIAASAKEALGAGLGLKFAMEAMGGAAEAAAGPVGILVGIITLIGASMAASAEATRKADEEIRKYRDHIREVKESLGELTREQNIAALTESLAAAMQKRSKAEQLSIDWPKSILAGFIVYKDAGSSIQAAEAEVIDARKALSDAFGKYTKEDTKASDEATKTQIENEKELAHATKERIRQQSEEAERARAKQKRELVNLQPVGTHAHGVEAQQFTFEEAMGGWMTGIGVLQDGFAALAQGISQGLARAFGEATSLFQMFVQGVVQGIAQIATQLASSAIIAGIFSLLTSGGFSLFGNIFGGLTGHIFGHASGGTLYEPVVGVGPSGRMYSFAENSPERFSSLSGSGGGGNSSTHIYGETRIDKGDIVISWKEGRNRDRMKGANY